MLKQILKKIFTFRKILTFLLIAVGAGLTFLVYRISNQVIVTNSLTWIERLYYSVQIVSGIYIVVGAVIGVWQYYISTRSEIIKNESDKVSKAIELAEFYKNDILTRYAFVKYIFDELGVTEIIQRIEDSKMVRFDAEELNANFTEEDVKELQDKFVDEKVIDIVFDAICIYGMGVDAFSSEVLYRIRNATDDGNKKELLSKIETLIVNVVVQLLNDLEYFALYFTHNSADESVVYQSLHQTYLCVVERLYYHISKQNEISYKKYYTNVIGLYSHWKNKYLKKKNEYEKYEEKKTKINKEQKGLQETGTVIQSVLVK